MPPVGGATGGGGAVYSKGRACALSQFLGSWPARACVPSPRSAPLVLLGDFLSLSLVGLGRGHSSQSGAATAWSGSCGVRRVPQRAIGARGEPASGRAPTARCGDRSRPARARPPPSSLLPPPPPHLPLLLLCLGCSAARLALGEPQRQRRVSHLETEPGRGGHRAAAGRTPGRAPHSPSLGFGHHC